MINKLGKNHGKNSNNKKPKTNRLTPPNTAVQSIVRKKFVLDCTIIRDQRGVLVTFFHQ